MSREIDARELDARVAVEIMGWAWYTFMNTNYVFGPYAEAWGYVFGLDSWSGWTSGRNGETTEIDPVSLSGREGPPRYSSEMSDSWLVVEKMEAEGFDWTVSPNETEFNRQRGPKGDCLYGTSNPAMTSVPGAICLAALAAIDGADRERAQGDGE